MAASGPGHRAPGHAVAGDPDGGTAGDPTGRPAAGALRGAGGARGAAG